MTSQTNLAEQNATELSEITEQKPAYPVAFEHKGRKVTITPMAPEHHDAYIPLLRGYREFYGLKTEPAAFERVWKWLMDPSRVFEGVIMHVDGVAVSFLHFSKSFNPVSGHLMGYIDDVYVDEKYRGMGLAQIMMEYGINLGNERGYQRSWWITDDNNYPGKKIYDRIGKKALWNVYSAANPAISV